MVTKYRAWDRQKRKMYNVRSIRFYHKTKTYTSKGRVWMVNDDEIGGRPLGAVELLQYTGLKDRNETEIFVGDVVKIPNKEILYEVVFEVTEDMKSGFYLDSSELVKNKDCKVIKTKYTDNLLW